MIEVHVERIVLHGDRVRDATAIEREVVGEVTRALAEEGLAPSLVQSGGADVLTAPASPSLGASLGRALVERSDR